MGFGGTVGPARGACPTVGNPRTPSIRNRPTAFRPVQRIGRIVSHALFGGPIRPDLGFRHAQLNGRSALVYLLCRPFFRGGQDETTFFFCPVTRNHISVMRPRGQPRIHNRSAAASRQLAHRLLRFFDTDETAGLILQ
jgi:hypothetical protein